MVGSCPLTENSETQQGVSRKQSKVLLNDSMFSRGEQVVSHEWLP